MGLSADRPVKQVAAMLAHEAMHVVQRMQDDLNKGEQFDPESQAYLIQWVTQCCIGAWESDIAAFNKC